MFKNEKFCKIKPVCMQSIRDQIAQIEEEIRKTPYHKATEHHIGKLRAKLARLREKEIEKSLKKGGGVGYAVKKQGDATVVIIGPPSCGKSTLLNSLTNAKSKVASYAFTTVGVIPGIMEYKDAKIQILDLPGLIEGAEEGKGRGKEVLSVARIADLLIIMTDVQKLDYFKKIEKILYANGVRINIVRPKVSIEKRSSGGIVIQSNIKQDLSYSTIKEIANEMGIKNAQILLNEKVNFEGLIDALSINRVYIPAIYVVNKVDLINYQTEKLKLDSVIFISAEKEVGLDNLREKIWRSLGLIRVFLIKPGEKPNFKNPVVMKNGQTLYDLALKIGEEFAKEKSRAKIWGTAAKFPEQEVSLSTNLVDGMQIRFI